jgi:inosine-uridine nucleoside N-ribohydrolase
VHGKHLPIPEPRSAKQRQRAVEFLVETYLGATEPITLVPVGPLTNIAMALKLEPRIVERIPQTVIMGGGHEVGNSTPAAEFNVWADPEAAQVVFRAGLQELTLVPLDATHQALVTLDDCRRLRELGTPAATAAADFQERRIHSYNEFQPMDISDSAPIHDALAVAYLIDPSVVSGLRAHVDVEIHGELTVGRTVIDTHGRSKQAPNAFVALDADTPKFVALLLETLARR